MRNAGDLQAEIATVCPVVSVTIGDPDDRTTWSFVPDPSATPAQYVAGQQVLSSFDINGTGPDTLNRNAAQAVATSFDPFPMMARNGFRIVFASLVETRNKVNELVAAVNGKLGTSIQPLTNRTWGQVVQALKAAVQAESDPNT